MRRPRPLQGEERVPAWLSAENVRLETRDGERLGAWLAPAAPGRASVLLLHGMGGSRASLAPHARRLSDGGRGFLALSLRGFGDSTGDELDFGWSSRADVVAAVELLERASPGAPLVIVGQSLGAAAAIFAAGELGARVDGYVLEAPYRDLEKACRDRLSQRLVAPLDSVAYAGLCVWAPAFLPVGIDALRPIDHVARIPAGTPVLFVAGALDREAPPEDVLRLGELCGGDAEVVVLEGRDHKDLWELDERHWELWRSLLERVESSARAASR